MRCLFNIFVSKTLVAELYLLLKCIWCCTPWANFSLGYIWDDLDVKTSMQYQTPNHVIKNQLVWEILFSCFTSFPEGL